MVQTEFPKKLPEIQTAWLSGIAWKHIINCIPRFAEWGILWIDGWVGRRSHCHCRMRCVHVMEVTKILPSQSGIRNTTNLGENLTNLKFGIWLLWCGNNAQNGLRYDWWILLCFCSLGVSSGNLSRLSLSEFGNFVTWLYSHSQWGWRVISSCSHVEFCNKNFRTLHHNATTVGTNPPHCWEIPLQHGTWDTSGWPTLN